jgi:hypothetical protein
LHKKNFNPLAAAYPCYEKSLTINGNIEHNYSFDADCLSPHCLSNLEIEKLAVLMFESPLKQDDCHVIDDDIHLKGADSNDSAFCILPGQNAVHTGITGRTEMIVGAGTNTSPIYPYR